MVSCEMMGVAGVCIYIYIMDRVLVYLHTTYCIYIMDRVACFKTLILLRASASPKRFLGM